MKKPYRVGLIVVLLSSVATLAIKASFTKYPGFGDFMLFFFIGKILPTMVVERLFGLVRDPRIILYPVKALLGLLLFSTLYFGLKKTGKAQLPVALIFTVAALAAMSLGEAVVG